jgi:D-alanine-D-alanine ligase
LSGEFFDYKAKYDDPHGCDIKVPADIPTQMQEQMRRDAKTVFKILRGEGLARVDFLLGSDGKYCFSEINTMPGMSLESLFPQLWSASSKKYEDILDFLINSALKRSKINKEFSLDR